MKIIKLFSVDEIPREILKEMIQMEVIRIDYGIESYFVGQVVNNHSRYPIRQFVDACKRFDDWLLSVGCVDGERVLIEE